MRPQQDQLYNDKCAGIDDILIAQQGPDQRDHQRRRVAVDHIHLFHGIQLQRTAQQCTDPQQHYMDSRRNSHGVQKSLADLWRVVDLERIDDDTGRDQIYHNHREHFAVTCLQQPCFDHGVAHDQDQEQLRDLLGQKNADLHCFSSFPSCVVKAQKESRLSARQLSPFDSICRLSAAPHAAPDRLSPHWAGTRRTCAE